MTDERSDWVKAELAAYEQLTPEMRAVVQEYGNMPWDPNMPAEEFRAQEERMAQLEQEYLYNLAGV